MPSPRAWEACYQKVAFARVDAIPEGTYDVIVESVLIRKGTAPPSLVLDLEVLRGPSVGATPQVEIHVPQPGTGAFLLLWPKIAGFENLGPAIATMTDEPETSLETLASALVGQTVFADIALRSDGRNELVSTESRGPSRRRR
jgi:hypothetical protein